ncbi:MAG: N-methylproline demethylase, partial [Alphaproteobacteria bacterium]
MAPYDSLLKPLRIKGVTIRNRVMSTAHAAGFMEHGRPGERYRLYQEEKAKGGIGLTICGGASAVSHETPAEVFNSIALTDDQVIPSLRELTDSVHRHGAAAFCQITHLGRRTRWDVGHWLPAIAPSPVREPMHRSFPKEMEDWDFRRVILAYAQAARRVMDGGFDGCELSNAHQHLIDQFWTPAVNRRGDRYGGSLANRMRFGLEVLQGIRDAVGPDFVVGMRMSGDELLDDGLGPEECVQIARAYAGSGLVDFLSVVAGQAQRYADNVTMIPNMSY